MTWIWRVRAALLTLAGALVVHRGRYAFSEPEHVHALSAAHAYLTWLAPLASVLLFLAVVHLAATVRSRSASVPELPRARTLWAASAATLVAVFMVQETAELTLTHGHLPHVAEILGGSGWITIPLAAAAGAVIALLLRGAARVVEWALAVWRGHPQRTRAAGALPPRPVLLARQGVLARRLAGRAPPRSSSVA